jgi:phospholipid/cholesterol/gamma-HCH transport system substrate-binding protein
MIRSRNAPALKFAAFAVVMALLTGFLFLVFAQTRTGATRGYTAIFADVSHLRPGNTVRVAGVRVGTVSDVTLQPDKRVAVKFDADDNVELTDGTRAAVRYLNLVGDRYLELTDGPGSTHILPRGSVIPVDRTSPALDLDLLLGGLKPVIHGLDAQQVNALTASLVQIFQGQGDNLNSLLSQTSSFTTALADNSEVIQQLIDNLKTLLATVGKDGEKFSAAIDQLEQLVTALSQHRDPIGDAITALSNGTASVADLLNQARPPLAGSVAQAQRLATNLTASLDILDTTLQKAPENFRKLVRTGAYGAFIQYYLCDITIRIDDNQGRVMVLPMVKQNYGRCT